LGRKDGSFHFWIFSFRIRMGLRVGGGRLGGTYSNFLIFLGGKKGEGRSWVGWQEGRFGKEV